MRRAGGSRNGTWEMFDGIAARYDLLNRVLSFGRDRAWRRALARQVRIRSGLRVLDAATGTGDVLAAVAGEHREIGLGVGWDMAGAMLGIARRKFARLGFDDRLAPARGDAQRVAFPDETFDAVTIAFGIRNVQDVGMALREFHRVLKPGGQLLTLEFSIPDNRPIRRMYLFYFRHILPFVGGIVSSDRAAYRYLNRSVESFPYGEAFCARIRAAGFVGVRRRPLTWGIATLYLGEKPGA